MCLPFFFEPLGEIYAILSQMSSNILFYKAKLEDCGAAIQKDTVVYNRKVCYDTNILK